jgi:hypothetical protein
MLVALPRRLVGSRRPPPLAMLETTPAREFGTVGTHGVRGAAAAFVRGATLGWSRRDLANWLVCQYAPCALTDPTEDRDTRPPALERTLDDGIIARVIVDARAHVLRLLRDLTSPLHASPVARLAIATGAVAPRRDGSAAVLFVPVSLTRLRLHERAGSLFVADYLNYPHDYRRLRVCRDCGELSFTGELEHVGWCEATPSRC